MAPRVQQDVTKRVVHLTRRREEPHLVAFREDMPCVAGNAVYSTRKARADCHHAALKVLTILRFDDEVRVIALKRIVHEPKAWTRTASGEGSLDLTRDRHGAEQ